MKQSTKRLTSTIIGLLFLIGAFLVFLNMILPTISDASDLRAQKAAREQAIDVQNKAIKQLDAIMNSITPEEQAVVTNAMPLKPDMASTISQVSYILQASAMVPQAMSISQPASQTVANKANTNTIFRPVGSYNLQIRTVGSYANFKAFVSRLEKNMRIFDIKTVSITPAGKPTDDLYIYDLTVATYYQTN